MQSFIFRSIPLLFLFVSIQLFAQTEITGSVHDKLTGEPMLGVSIIIEGKIEGTITDMDGDFLLNTKEIPPFKIEISFIGYEKRRVEIMSSYQTINLDLAPRVRIGSQVVISASRIQEDVLTSPMTIEKLDALALRTIASPTAYGALANLRGVQMNTSSLIFTSINTRGFADAQNWRFIQTIDGMEMNPPGLNFPAGLVSTPPDLDIASIELVPGAGSALYGANAFNGMLSVKTKDAYFYQGLAIDLKGGLTVQDEAGVNPFGSIDFRYAKAFKNKFAFKIAGSALTIHDWEANDETYTISNPIAASGNRDDFLALDRTDPGFDAVNRYGDESAAAAFVDLGDTSRLVHRTGYSEGELLNYNHQLYKMSAGLYYRFNADLELSYEGRIIQGDAILRESTMYYINNFVQHYNKLELKGSKFNVRAYYSGEDAGDTYYLLGTGAFIEEALKPNAVWGADYGAAYRGDISEIAAGDHAAARAYADRDMAGSDTEAFQALLDTTTNNADFTTGGSKFFENSGFLHAEANYDFSELWEWVEFQAGISSRYYRLDSKGSLFNDGVNGFNSPIPIFEIGGYVQASRSFFKDRINLRASARFDKNQNFAGRFTPRASVVFALDKERKHNIRVSYQTGFRNPSTQEAFVALDLKQGILLGGLERNLQNYNYSLPTANFITGAAAGTVVNGTVIHDSLVALTSLSAYFQSGERDSLEFLNLPYLRQEKVTAYELGYRALIAERLFIDAFGYYNVYNNFVYRVDGFSLETQRAFSLYSNIEDRIWSVGAGLTIEYLLPANYIIGGNYAFTDFNADKALANNPSFLPIFNTPKHRFNLSLVNRNIWNNLGFSLKFQWSDSYTWQSQFGQGDIDAFSSLDAALMYQLPKVGMSLKMGGTNLLFKEYKQMYAGPNVGSVVYIGITYDPFVYKNAVSRATKQKPKEKEVKRKIGGFEN